SNSLQSACSDSKDCEEDVNKTYNTMKNLQYDEVQTKLRELLHSDQSYVFNLTCSNNQNQSENINRSGIIIESNTMEEPDTEASFTCVCTKLMCNGIQKYAQVQQLLLQYGLLPLSDIIPPVIQETTTTTLTTMRT
ncbi:unnamed protein product, partial [Rotaria sordida]